MKGFIDQMELNDLREKCKKLESQNTQLSKKLEALGIGVVSNRRELLIAFNTWMHKECLHFKEANINAIEEVDAYLKSNL